MLQLLGGAFVIKKVNLKDVAALAGVSQGTASKVLNNIKVRDESQVAVERAMKELNYTPNLLARSLKISASNTIGVMVADISSPIAALLVSSMQSVAQQHQYDIVFYNTKGKPEKEKEAIRIFVEKRVMGIVYTSNTMTPATAESLKALNIPFVLATTHYEDMISVTIDNRKAAYDAVSYLIRKGHRKIAMISGPLDDPNAGFPRYEGYCQALLEVGIDPTSCPTVFTGYRMENGFHGARMLLDQEKEFTALFCASDESAIGAIKMLTEYGMTVPVDVSVMGFDGIELGKYITPTLSTVEQPFDEIGQMAMQVLFRIIETDSTEQSITLNHRLIIENSVMTK